MVIVAIILGVIAVICGVIGLIRYFSDDEELVWVALFFVVGVMWLIAFFGCIHWEISSKQLTGYIYSSSTTRGFTTAHIRFSQNAGTDSQPEFCVKADSDAGRAIQKYTGSDTKVNVNIPSYFYFTNNPFACGTTAMTVTPVTK
jgi:zinc transporter ZupT